MNSRTSKDAKAALEEAIRAQEAAPKQRISLYEKTYHQFSDELIERAHQARTDLSPLLKDLNRIAVLTAGMGAVMRIVGGNCVVADTHEPDDEKSEPPLSNYAIGALENMVTELCEMISGDIEKSVDWLRKRVDQ